ncbi:hypothetical protein C0J52_03162 [Blattella germanica]|nr:hypothetical protein C0J52_03162 [Blattella germanica]
MPPVPDVCPEEECAGPWLTKQFLEKALRKGNANPRLAVISYDVKPAVGKGDNYCSDLYRLKVHSSDGKESNLIIKKELEEGEFAMVVQKSTVFVREVQMYSTTAIQLHDILEKAMPGVCEPFAAQYVYSSPGIIVVHDLCAQGFQMAGRRQGLDLDHCLLVMRTLAHFHAASVVLQDQNPDSMACYQHNFFSEPATREGLGKFMSESVRGVAKAVESWPDYGDRYASKLRALAEEMLDRVIECTQRQDGGFNVLAHADLWVNNMLFRYSGTPGRSVDGLRFVDFQFLHFTSPAVDLEYFFNTSLSPDVRRHCMGQLLKEYHRTLCNTLDVLGYAHKKVSLDELKEDCHKHVIYGVHAACCVLPLVLSEKGVDLDALIGSGDKQASEVYNCQFYKTALQSMLPYFDEHGAFRS